MPRTPSPTNRHWRLVAEALGQVLAALNSDRPLEDVLDLVVMHARTVLGADGSAVFLRDDDGRFVVRASRGVDPEYAAGIRVLVGHGSVGVSIAQRRPISVSDLREALRTDPTFVMPSRERGLVERLARTHQAVLSVPLNVADGVSGAISQYYRERRAFPEADVALATTFADQAALAIHNAGLRTEAERRTQELEALYRADEGLHRSLRLADVLQALVDVAADILGADKTTVMVWDEEHAHLVPGAARGFSPETLAGMVHAPGEGVTTRVALSGQPIAVEDARSDPRVAHRITDPEGIRSLLHVPIVVDGAVFGVFGVNYCQPRRFGGQEQRLLEALAHRAALAIENARLYGQAQEAAALQERQRLARELHDAVTQALFSASLIADVLPRLWDLDPDQGRGRLDELRQLTRGALAEMRALLLELRPGALTDVGLGELLQHLSEACASRTGLPVALTVEGEGALPPEVQVALYRIAQEALGNAARHAGAEQLSLDLRLGESEVALQIADDGRGFDPTEARAGHFGLDIMGERAEAIGASLAFDSRAGGGTQIRLVWPRR